MYSEAIFFLCLIYHLTHESEDFMLALPEPYGSG